MAKREKTTNAVEILHRRYIKDDAERKASVQAERVNAEVAQLIYDLRKNAGLTQKELAELIDTTQSVVSRLEDADYDGHSLSILQRVAEALKQKLTVEMTAMDPDVAASQRAFLLFLRMLRRRKGLSVDELAKRSGIDRTELLAIEWNNGYRPTPLTLHKLGEFYSIPQRRLAAILFADVVGYVRLMEADEADTLERLKAHRADLIDPRISEYHGVVVKNIGDAVMAEFGSVLDAVLCAVEIQTGMAERNRDLPEGRRMLLRIGINLGDVVIEAGDIFGGGVNLASRLEGLAKPGGICISAAVYEQIWNKCDLAFDDLGELEIKNVAEPVRVYALQVAPVT